MSLQAGWWWYCFSVFTGRVRMVVMFACVCRQGEGGGDVCVCSQAG